MSYQVTYAENNLHDYFKILNIKRTLLPPRENFTKDIPSINGLYYTGYKYTPKVYELECAISAIDRLDLVDKIQLIAFILDTKEPSKLILGDNPDRFTYAVVDGEIDFEKLHNTGKFTIKFICYDPMAYSIEEDEFYADSKKIITIENGGTTESLPKSSIEFSKDAYFLQCTNYDKQTILVGVPPSADNPIEPWNPNILKDNCETLTGWNSVSNVLDAGREVTGSLVINGGGYGITLGSHSGNTSNKWYGGALRKNLGQNLTDFKIEVKLEHNSEGKLNGGGITPPSSSVQDYIVTADPSLRVRSGRGTTHSQIGSYKKGTTISISNIDLGWGQVTYSGKIGYVSMDYVKIKESTSSSSTNVNYKISAREGVNLRENAGTNYKKLNAIPYGTTVTVTEVKNGWGKTSYGGKIGYFALQYASKVTSTFLEEESSTENKLGMIEVYGFSQSGTKLFKFKICDNQKWYEYTEPEIEFGSKKVLDDNKNCPSPKTVNVKDDEGKDVVKDGVVQKKTIDSGAFGDWNEFKGWFSLERITIDNKQKWFAKIEKIGSDGKTSRTIQTQTLTGNYPTESLNNIVVFIGGYNNEPIIDCMNIDEIYVTNLSSPPLPQQKKPLFKQGDEVILDHTKQKVYLNGKLFMSNLDIGSQFFSNPVGESQFIFKSDDENINIISTIQKKWL